MDPAHLLPPWFRSTDACLAIGDWLRRFHNAQNGFEPDPSMPWRRYAGRALRHGEVVVHHDVAPYNTIRRPDGGLTVIDWDFCGPGDPVEDLAFSAWQWIPLWADKVADQACRRPRGDGGRRPRFRQAGRPGRRTQCPARRGVGH